MPQAVAGAIIKAVGAKGFAAFLIKVAVYVAFTAVTSKLFGPKIPASLRGLKGPQVMVRSAVENRKIVYGQAAVSGPIFYNNTSGDNREYLWICVALADGEIEGFVDVWMDGDQIPVADIAWIAGASGADGSGTGNVSTAKWIGENATNALQIYFTLGHANQVAMGNMVSAFTQWTTNHRLRGVSYVVAKCLYDEDTEDIWKHGPPQNVRAVIKGRKIYDPRLDSTVVIDPTTSPVTFGSGSHRYTDATTWEWSDNPSLCVADYLVNYIGAAAATAIDWPAVAAAADDCEVLVDIDTASPVTTEKRFTCNGPITLGASHRDNLNELLSSMDGKLAYFEGKWRVRASVWEASSVTFDESDFAGDIEIRGSAPVSERFNTVRGVFVDPSRKYEPSEFPFCTRTAYTTRDNGKILERDLKLPMTNSVSMAQRIAFRMLDQSNNQIVAKMKLNARGAKCTISDIISVDLPSMGWSSGGNLCGRSEDFTIGGAGEWQSAQMTEALDAAVDPWGRLEANSFTETATFGTHYSAYTFTSTADTVYTFSVWLKAGLRDWIAVAIVTKGGQLREAYFNLATGELGSDDTGSGGAPFEFRSSHMESAGNGWYRCSVSVEVGDASPAGNTSARVYAAFTDGGLEYSGSAASPAFYGIGAQIEASYEPGLYLPTLDGNALVTTPKDFRVIEWQRNTDGTFDVTGREDSSTSYDDPAGGDYATSSTGGITVPTDVVPAPTSLTATPVQGGVLLSWTDPPSRTYEHIEIWSGSTDSLGSASLLTTVPSSPHTDNFSNVFAERFYWVRAYRSDGAVSAYEPDNSPDTGVGAYPEIQLPPLLADPFIRLGSSYWDLTAGTDNAVYRAGSGLNGTDAIDVQPGSGTTCGFWGAERRGPDEYDAQAGGRMVIEVRWRLKLNSQPGGSWSQYIYPRVRVSDEGSPANAAIFSPALSARGRLWSNSDSAGTWYDESCEIIIEDTGTPPRFIQVGLFTGDNALGPEWYVDLIDANVKGQVNELTAVGVTHNTVSSVAGVLTIDLNDGNSFQCTLTENITSVVINNVKPTGVSHEFKLGLIQASSGGPYTYSGPSGQVTPNAGGYSVSTGAGDRDKLFYETDDGGTTWDLTFVKAMG